MNARFDVLGIGCCTVDDFLYVEAFPLPDSKTRVLEERRDCGGLTATALVAAARLGAHCAYGGVLGHDEYSRFVEETLQRENVDTTHVVRREDARPIHSTIIVDTTNHTRNIFAHRNGASGADDLLPADEIIRSARVLFLDHHGTSGGIRAAKIARMAKIPVVADFERANVPRFDELFSLVDHLILPQQFALQLASTRSAPEAAQKLWTPSREAVVVTCGADGCWSVDANGVQHFPAFGVETVDTTGCGDVWHGAYAAALARGESLEARIRFASAAAAIKATRHGAQAGAPTRDEVEQFLAARCDAAA